MTSCGKLTKSNGRLFTVCLRRMRPMSKYRICLNTTQAHQIAVPNMGGSGTGPPPLVKKGRPTSATPSRHRKYSA